MLWQNWPQAAEVGRGGDARGRWGNWSWEPGCVAKQPGRITVGINSKSRFFRCQASLKAELRRAGVCWRENTKFRSWFKRRDLKERDGRKEKHMSVSKKNHSPRSLILFASLTRPCGIRLLAKGKVPSYAQDVMYRITQRTDAWW